MRRIRQLDDLIEDPSTPAAERGEHRRERAAAQRLLARRNVEAYGAITLKTDGRGLVIAFRLDKQRAGASPKRWQTYTFRHDPIHGFMPVP